MTYNDSPYFDKHNLILHFPVRLHGTTKTIQDYPPIKMPVYAIIGNFEDLTISCNSTRNLSNFLNTILIDVGDCSIYETIWTEISVTNNTAVTQLCGFVNLPKVGLIWQPWLTITIFFLNSALRWYQILGSANSTRVNGKNSRFT